MNFMWYSPRVNMQVWRQVESMIRSFLKSGELKHEVTFTYVEAENLKAENEKLRAALGDYEAALLSISLAKFQSYGSNAPENAIQQNERIKRVARDTLAKVREMVKL